MHRWVVEDCFKKLAFEFLFFTNSRSLGTELASFLVVFQNRILPELPLFVT